MSRIEKLVVALIVCCATFSFALGSLLIWNLTALTDIRGRVIVLYEMHDRVDDNGIPLWYIPRGTLDELRRIREQVEDSHKLIGASQ